jgi:hypothetical protein
MPTNVPSATAPGTGQSGAAESAAAEDGYIPEPDYPYTPPTEAETAASIRVTLDATDLHLTHSGEVMTEAPFSATVAVESPNGFQWLVTVRRGPEGGIEAAMVAVEGKLRERSYKPQERRPFPRGAPVPAQEGAARSPDASQAEEGDTKPCPVHPGFHLKKQTKDGKSWWSHPMQERGQWCHGK